MPGKPDMSQDDEPLKFIVVLTCYKSGSDARNDHALGD